MTSDEASYVPCLRDRAIEAGDGMSLLGNAAKAVLHPVQFVDHVGDAAWHEVANRVLGGSTTNEQVFGRALTAEELSKSPRRRT